MSDPRVQEVMKEQKEAKRAKVIKMRDTNKHSQYVQINGNNNFSTLYWEWV